jgi:hypothetical protein
MLVRRPSHRPGPEKLIPSAVIAGIILALGSLTLAFGVAIALSVALAIGLIAFGCVFCMRDRVGALLALLLFEVVQSPFAALVGYTNTAGQLVRRADEVLILGIFSLTLASAILGRYRSQRILRYMLPGIVFLLSGIVSAIAQDVPLSVTVIGAGIQWKWWAILYIALMAPWRPSDLQRVLNALMFVGVTLTIFGLVDFVAQGAFRELLRTNTVSVTSDLRSDHAVQSIFTTPGKFSIVMSMLTAVALAAWLSRRKRIYGLYVVVFGAMALLSLRITALFSVFLLLLVVWFFSAKPVVHKILAFLGMVVFIAAMTTVFYGQLSSHIATYSQPSATARGLLFITSEKIATEHAPFGSGFGTFASAESRLNYSPLYEAYGLSRVYGLSREYPHFIDDTMWPAILGESGYIGLFGVICGFSILAMEIVRRIKGAWGKDQTFPLAAFGALVCVIVASAANPVMFDGLYSTIFALLVAPALIRCPVGAVHADAVPDLSYSGNVDVRGMASITNGINPERS